MQRILLWKSTCRYVEKPSRKNMRNKVPFAFDKYMTEWHLLKGCTIAVHPVWTACKEWLDYLILGFGKKP